MNTFRNKRFLAAASSITILCIALFFTFRRLFYGVDLTDEAFYSGIPYEFYLGRRPFIDELNILQFPSFLLYPIFKLFFVLNDGTDGVILYNRILFFCFFFFVSLVVFIAIKRIIPFYSAILIAFSSLCFIPNNIPALSYNTLGYGFLTLSLFIVYYATTVKRKRNLAFYLAGLLFGFSIISYPTMIIPFVLYCILLLIVLAKMDAVKSVAFFLLGSVTAAIPILIIMGLAGVENVSYFLNNLNYVGVQGGGSGKVITEINKWIHFYPNKKISFMIVMIILISYCFKKKSPVYYWVLLLLPTLGFDFSFKSGPSPIQQSLFYINNYIVFSPLLLLLHRQDKEVQRMFILIFLPSIFAGMTFLWSSSNGFTAAGLGLFPASLAFSLMIIYIINHSSLNNNLKQIFSILIPCIILILMVFMQIHSVYRDAPIKELSTKIEFGPYKGLYTSNEKGNFLGTFNNDINTFSKSSKRIFFYSHIPGGYLFSNIKPAGNTIWVFTYTNDFSVYSNYYENHPKPDVVFRMKYLINDTFLPLNYSVDNDLNQFVNKEYSIVYSNQYYDILTQNIQR